MPGHTGWLILIFTVLLSAHAAKTFAIGFTSPANYRVGNTPIAAATGDFNRDGKSDVAVANSDSSSVSIRLGAGAGTFQSTVGTYIVPQSPRALAIADFNGNGLLDIVLTTAGSIVVLPGKGDGTFGAAITSSGDALPGDLVVGDLNGDERLDLAVVEGGNVSVFLGKGNGTFQPPIDFSIGRTVMTVATGDFNHDGRRGSDQRHPLISYLAPVVTCVDSAASRDRVAEDGVPLPPRRRHTRDKCS